MKDLKHTICLLLISAMLFGILPTGVFADTAITEVNITGFRTPYVGRTAGTNLASVDVPEGAHYEITSLDWQKAANGNFLEGSDDFAAGNEYYVCFVLSPAEGYAFAENCTVLINGAADLVDGDYTRLNADGTMTFYSVDLEPTVPQVVTKIDLTGFVMPQVGQTAGGNLASLSVPDGAGYTITEAIWRSGGEEMAASDCFTAGTTCYICFTVALAEGYVFDFDEGAVVYINGAETLVDSDYTGILADNTLQCYTVDLTPGDGLIEEVRVNGFTLPQPGDTAANNLAGLSVPAGAHYSIYSAAWWHYQPDAGNPAKMNDGDVFTAGERAYLYITFAPADGYRFDRDALPTATGFDPQYVNDSYLSNDGRLCAYVSTLTVGGTAALTPIETVFVNGFTLPQPGDTPAQNLAGLSVPAGAHYSIDDAYWLHSGTGSGGSSAMNGDDVFTENEWAYLAIVFSPANGYRFDEDALPTVNGLAPLALNYSYVSYDGTLHAVSTGFTVGSEPGVDTAIKTVAVNGFTVPQPGDTVSANLALLSLPEGAHYYIGASGWYDEAAFKAMSGSDVFDANKTYSLWVRLNAYTGYTLSSATVPYVNGGTDLVDYANCDYYDSEDFYQIWTVVVQPGVGPIEYVPIEEVNINGFTVPQPGDTVSENLALLSLPSGAHYYVGASGWYDEAASKAMSGSDVFDANKTYSLWVRIYANSGYTLSNETVPYVNGGTDFVDYNYCSYYNSSGYYRIWTVVVQPGVGPVGDILIEEININGFAAPTVGQTVGEYVASLSVPEGAPYEIESAEWISGIYTIDASDMFEPHQTYYLELDLQPKEGYYFDKNQLPTVLFDGSGSYVDSSYTDVNFAGALVCFSIDFNLDPAPGTLPVGEIAINGFVSPRIGQTAGDNLASVTVPDGAPYTVSDMCWKNSGTPMAASDVFEAGETYYLVAAFSHADGYYFDPDNLPTFLVNGSDEYSDGYSLLKSVLSCFTVDYKMPAALRGDINADGSVNITDVTDLLNTLAGTGSALLSLCDLNGDGALNISDVTELLNILAGN